MDRIPIYLIALVVALAHMGTNIYDVHARNLGTVKAEPWRTKVSTGALRVTSAIRDILRGLWCHRRGLAIAGLLALAIFSPATLQAHGAGATGGLAIAVGIPQLETDLRAKQLAVKTLLEAQLHACDEHVVTAATATAPAVTGRLRTPEEKAAVQALLDEGKAIRARIDSTMGDANLAAEVDRLTAGMTERQPDGRQAPNRDSRSIGQRFSEDPAIRAFIKHGGHQVQQGVVFTSPAVEMPMSTLLDTSGGSGGPLIMPQVLPGVLPILMRRLVVADLIASGTTDSNAIIYMKELAVTNNAAAVAEGAQKPESALSFVQATDPVVKIATWIPTTTEMLEDFSAMTSLIDARLRMFLGLAEEDQLLNGSGIAPNMRGLMNRLALAAAIVRGADSNADAIFKQISAIATNAFIQPDGFVLNPLNWLTIQLTKNAAGNYLGTGPWAAAQQPMLWGLPGAITPAIVANTGFVGAFATCAQFFRKGGVKLAMSNSHLDFFTTNKVAILTEERGALAVYREAAFGKVTGLA